MHLPSNRPHLLSGILTVACAAVLAVLLVADASAFSGRSFGNGKGNGGGGGDDAPCDAADSRIAYSSLQSSRTIFTVNPDGSCMVQLTDGGQGVPVTWTADDHLLLSNALLDVPDATDASTVSTVHSYGRSIADISQHRDGTGILPVGQQLLLVEPGGYQSLEVCAVDDSGCVQVASYTDTYDGSDGIEYQLRPGRWLPPSSDLSRIRIVYHLLQIEHVGGTPVAAVEGYRVIGLDTAGWPAIGTSGLSDEWVDGTDEMLAGYQVGNYSYADFSRDGTVAVLKAADGSIYTIPLLYDELLDTTSFDVANAVESARDVDENVYNDIALSPDNSQIAYNANHLVGRGGNSRYRTSIWAIGAGAQSGSVELDGTDDDSFCCTVWGPSASAAPPPPPPPPVGGPPVADAGGAYAGTEDLALAFDGSGSSDPDSDPLSYDWDFGDGSTGSGANPSHSYLWGGSFTVTLTVSDGNGNSDTDTATVTVTEVNDPPVALAGGPYAGTVGEALGFDGSGSFDYDNADGTTANDQALGYSWTFGDSGTGSGASPSHTYASDGTFNVALTVDDGVASSVDATTASVSAAPPPPAGMHVGDLDGWGSNENGNRWRAHVTILVHDDGDNPVSGVTVSGSWISGASGSASCTTNASGTCTVTSANKKKSQVSTITFEVDGLSHGSLVYVPAGNHDPDGDSDGTTIDVSKP